MTDSGTLTPPLSRRPSAPDVHGTIPLQLTSFVGREREIAAVGELLRSSRLLTLTGAGGAGKTRLALEVVRQCDTEQAWVELGPLGDPALVSQTVAGALGVREESGRNALEILIERMRDRELLLILDNCEHLVDACASLAEDLLRHCPGIRILATSREALGVSGEQAWLVPPLSLPATSDADPDAVSASESGRLFLDRARAVAPSFVVDRGNAAAVSQICRQLDGIPLAIELAAARVRVLAPEQIAARLAEGFKVLSGSVRSAVSRHRTLREAIDWSHALLDESEAALFRRLSVFAGSFCLDAVEAICPGPPVETEDVLDLLSALVDKSLVAMENCGAEARYRVLETLRQYGGERLAAAGEEDTLRGRHARYFVDLAVRAERPTFGGASDPSWTERLVSEEGNLRAAADWTQEEPARVSEGLRLATALHWHWFARGHFREGWRRLASALEHGRDADALVRAKALTAFATMTFWLGKVDEILAPAEEAVTLLRGLDDRWSLIYALTTYGVGLSLTDPPAAEQPLAEAVAIAHADRSVLKVFAMYWQARIAFGRGELERAGKIFRGCVEVAREMGSPPALAHSLSQLGLVEIRQAALAPAREHLLEALRIHSSVGDVLGTVWTLEALAGLAVSESQLERAARLLSAVQAERERIGVPWAPADREPFHRLRDDLRTRLGTYLFSMSWSAGQGMALDQAVEFGLRAEEGCAPAPEPKPQHHALTTTGELRVPGRMDVRALGPLVVVIDGRELPREAWNSAKPRELLLFLLSHPGGCTREQVGLAFWPDASSEQVRNNFHVTLHRLRKTLGDPGWVTLTGDHYQLDPDALVEIDAVSFEAGIPDALKRLRAGDHQPIENLIAMYRGDFLERETAGDWHLEIRDRLRREYQEALLALGNFRVQAKDWTGACDVFRRVIASDPLHEPAYRNLMSSLAALGERSEAFKVYERLEQLLEKELDATPEDETRKVYQGLKMATRPL